MTTYSTLAPNQRVLLVLTGALWACSTNSPLHEQTSGAGSSSVGSDTGSAGDEGPEPETDTSGPASESETGNDGSPTGDGDGDGDGASPVGVCNDPDPGWVGSGEDGDPVPHWVTVDYQGEVFELCSLGGTPVFVDIFTGWCSPCNDMAAWMTDQGTDSNGVEETYKQAVNEGKLIWLEVMVEGWTSGEGATLADAQQWHDAYPHPTAVLVIDEGSQLYDYTGGWSFPTLRLIGHDFIWRDFDSLAEVLDAAMD